MILRRKLINSLNRRIKNKMEKETWFYIGMMYLAILFGTGIASLKPYNLGSWLSLSAFLMMLWLISVLLIDKEDIKQKN